MRAARPRDDSEAAALAPAPALGRERGVVGEAVAAGGLRRAEDAEDGDGNRDAGRLVEADAPEDDEEREHRQHHQVGDPEGLRELAHARRTFHDARALRWRARRPSARLLSERT